MAKKRGTKPKAKHQIVRAAARLPEGYEEFLGQLKERIRTARLRAALGFLCAGGGGNPIFGDGTRPKLMKGPDSLQTLTYIAATSKVVIAFHALAFSFVVSVWAGEQQRALVRLVVAE